MKKNNHEIEIKFEVKNSDSIRKILSKYRAKFTGKAFERTVRFDTLDKGLEKNQKFLRVRTGFKNTITFKQKIENKRFRERKEIELEIKDPEKMIMILKSLGFTKILIMEKYREKWLFENTEIVIDKLPMGTFIEIEGSEKSIDKVVEILNLDSEERILGTYWDLWRDFTKKKKINQENIVFKKKSA
ncbi:MAG: class IV adenylate cyclase [Candidatus Pacebacteria bacterium]|nr:class IV adenylate cyclase [Candidatus Paceibacterota bacterium]